MLEEAGKIEHPVTIRSDANKISTERVITFIRIIIIVLHRYKARYDKDLFQNCAGVST